MYFNKYIYESICINGNGFMCKINKTVKFLRNVLKKIDKNITKNYLMVLLFHFFFVYQGEYLLRNNLLSIL